MRKFYFWAQLHFGGITLGASPLAVAAPTGGAVVGGSGTISQSGTASHVPDYDSA